MAQHASRSRIVAAIALVTLGIATLASMVLLSAQISAAITPPTDPAPSTPAYVVTLDDLPDTVSSPTLNVTGTSAPLENMTVQVIGGNDSDVYCNTTASAEGTWACLVGFAYNDGIEVQAYRNTMDELYLEDFDNELLGYVSPVGIDQTWGNLYWDGQFTYGIYGDRGDGSSVEILLDGEPIDCDFYPLGEGWEPTDWYCELNAGESSWAEGSYTVTAVPSVTDGVDTWTGESASATLIVERDSPAMATFTYPKQVSANPPANLHALRLIESVGWPYFVGTGEPGAFVTVGYIDAENVSEDEDFSDFLMGESGTIIFCETQVWEDGHWACSADYYYTEMEPGHTYYVGTSQEDLATNRTESPTPQFRYTFSNDAIAPTFVSPTAGATVIGHNVTITGEVVAGQFIELYRYPAGGGEESEIFDCGNWIEPVAGEWSCAIENLPYGTYTFYALAVEDCGECSASVSDVVELTFTLAAPVIPPNVPVPQTTSTPSPIPWDYDLTDPDGNPIDPSDLKPGDTVVITADGLPPGAVVDVEIHSTPISLGSATVDSLGTLRMPITIPEAVEPGTHTLVATMTPPDGVASTVAVPVVVGAVAADDEPTDTGAEPSGEAPVDEPTSESTAGNVSDAGSGGADFSQPSTIGSTLQTWQTVQITPTTLAVVGAMTMALIVLVALPAELLQSTLSANYTRAFGWLAPVTARGRRFRDRIPAFLKNPKVVGFLTVATTALVLCFADPQFGWSAWSLRLWLAVFASLFMVNVVSMSIVRAVARRKYGVESQLDPMPATILIVAASVLVSRLAHIEPGFLFGVVVGVIFVRELMKIEEGRLASLGALVLIGLGIVSWLVYSLLPAAEGAGTTVQFFRDFTAAMTLESLSTLLIALLPLAFLEGQGIFKWHKAIWAVIYGSAVAAFVIVVVPMGDAWGDMRAPILGWTTLFFIFAVIATGVWAYFKLRPSPEPANEELESETVGER